MSQLYKFEWIKWTERFKYQISVISENIESARELLMNRLNTYIKHRPELVELGKKSIERESKYIKCCQFLKINELNSEIFWKDYITARNKYKFVDYETIVYNTLTDGTKNIEIYKSLINSHPKIIKMDNPFKNLTENDINKYLSFLQNNPKLYPKDPIPIKNSVFFKIVACGSNSYDW